MSGRLIWLECRRFFIALMVTTAGSSFCHADDKPVHSPASKKEPATLSLFDGKTLGHWQRADFLGESKVLVRDDALVMEKGFPINGVIWKGPKTPQSNYELTFEAQRITGNDFFATVTFPVKESACSLVLGGWGGGLTGLSSLNGSDASENETTGYFEFENKKWYRIRIRVTDDRIACWLDDNQIVNAEIEDVDVDIRIEMEFCRPLGIATYETTGAVRNLFLKKIDPK
ncbi:MAG TPA: DUF1080 domain-containing protein [Planctomicrobium sp.]|nr:DUF1080 domain-containing protein [Planctomicrobium sp.]